MTPKRQKLATDAFNQGILDEKNGRGISARLLIKESVRDFYDAARSQQRKIMAPEREAAQKGRDDERDEPDTIQV